MRTPLRQFAAAPVVTSGLHVLALGGDRRKGWEAQVLAGPPLLGGDAGRRGASLRLATNWMRAQPANP